jgi:hypothetical protein
LVHDIKNRKEKKNEIAGGLMLATTNNYIFSFNTTHEELLPKS